MCRSATHDANVRCAGALNGPAASPSGNPLATRFPSRARSEAIRSASAWSRSRFGSPTGRSVSLGQVLVMQCKPADVR